MDIHELTGIVVLWHPHIFIWVCYAVYAAKIRRDSLLAVGNRIYIRCPGLLFDPAGIGRANCLDSARLPAPEKV